MVYNRNWIHQNFLKLAGMYEVHACYSHFMQWDIYKDIREDIMFHDDLRLCAQQAYDVVPTSKLCWIWLTTSDDQKSTLFNVENTTSKMCQNFNVFLTFKTKPNINQTNFDKKSTLNDVINTTSKISHNFNVFLTLKTIPNINQTDFDKTSTLNDVRNTTSKICQNFNVY